ncbi:MAG: hypothetical protein GYB65_18060 [Chloroflexi bacterium]|nr:hypothetical protein [Chloroflexota bacterium]
MKKTKRFLVMVGLSVLLLTVASVVMAQGGDGYDDPEPEPTPGPAGSAAGNEPDTVTQSDVMAVASQLVINPQGMGMAIPIAACDSDLCMSWLRQIEDGLKNGVPADDIVSALLVENRDTLSRASDMTGAPTSLEPVEASSTEVSLIAETLVVDVNGGSLLSTCETDQCMAWQNEIALMLGQRIPRDQIIQQFVRQYGHAEIGDDELPVGVTWDDVNTVARKMFCETCEGVPLDECSSVDCRDWRTKISYMISMGYSRNEIMDYFTENFGADVVSLPRSRADRVLSFAVPLVVVLLLGGVGGWQMWRLRQRGHHTGDVMRRSSGPGHRPVPSDTDPYYLERLLQELEGVDQ